MKYINQNLFLIMLLATLSLLMSESVLAAPGDLDPTFGNQGIIVTGGRFVTSVALQSDGKIVVFSHGHMSLPQGCLTIAHSNNDNLKPKSEIAKIGNCFIISRYNSDGSLDTTFNKTGEIGISFDSYWHWSTSVVIQTDGKILAVGFSGPDFKENEINLIRLLPNGDLDPTFNGNGIVTTQISPLQVSRTEYAEIQRDGKIIVVGNKRVLQNGDLEIPSAILRYNSNGSLDTSFGSGGIISSKAVGNTYRVKIQGDGKILVQEEWHLKRLLPNGAPDLTFGKKGTLTTREPKLARGLNSGSMSFSIQPDGKIVISRSFYQNGKSFYWTARYNSDGFLDTSFNQKGFVQANTSFEQLFHLDSLVIEPTGKIIVGGNNYTNQVRLIRFDKNGILDPSFGNQGKITTFSSTDYFTEIKLAVQSDGKIILVGRNIIARFLTG